MKELDIYGDHLIEEDYGDIVEEVDHSDLMDLRPSNCLIWFANYGVEVVGLTGDGSQYISPDSVMFELVKALHENRNLVVDQILTQLNLNTYSVKAMSPDSDGED